MVPKNKRPDWFDRAEMVMEDRGITKTELSDKVRVSINQVSRAFAKRGSLFSTKTHQIADALGVSHEWLINGGDTPPVYDQSVTKKDRDAAIAEGVHVVSLTPYKPSHVGLIMVDGPKVWAVTVLK